MITPLPGATTTKPGSATLPFPGVSADLVDDDANPVTNGGGYLALTRPWPGMLRGIWGDPERFKETYWCSVPRACTSPATAPSATTTATSGSWAASTT